MISGWISNRAGALAQGDRSPPAGHSAERDASVHVSGSVVALGQGEPVFLDGEIASLARAQGAAVAWLALYRKAGVDAPKRVHGRFSFAVLDASAATAFIAVDRFATESLCYAIVNGRFCFATRSDMVPFASRELDPQAIFDYLYFHMIPAPRTVFPGVSRLEAGHSARFEAGRCFVDRYWRPQFVENARESFGSLRDEFRELLKQAVTRAADGAATGSFLSGGTDSSTVAGILGSVTGQPAKTYSIGFDAAGYDEMAYARIAAKHFGTDHHEYYVTPDDLVDGIGTVLRELDQPFGNSSVLPAYCCARMARADGVRKLLAGDGGDELFGGNTRYAKQRVFELYRVLPSPLRTSAIECVLDRMPRLASLPLLRKGASYVEQARVAMPDRLQMYNLLRRLGVANVLEPAFAASIDADSPLRQQRVVYDASGSASLINRMLAYDWKYTLADNDLPKVVAATNAAGVVAAFPLLDERLVDFSLRLAPQLKLRRLTLRWFFKAALRGFLPDAIIAKRKHGFGLPFGHWMVTHPRLREFAFASLSSFKARGYVRPAFIDELVDVSLPAHPGYYGELVWILMMLEQWLQRPAPLVRTQ